MTASCPKCGRFISKKDVDSGELEMIDTGYDDTINYVPMLETVQTSIITTIVLGEQNQRRGLLHDR